VSEKYGDSKQGCKDGAFVTVKCVARKTFMHAWWDFVAHKLTMLALLR